MYSTLNRRPRHQCSLQKGQSVTMEPGNNNNKNNNTTTTTTTTTNGALYYFFHLEYKTSVICHNVNTQKVKIARRDRPNILASNRCETFENLLHIDIAPLRSTLSGILHSKN